MCYVRRRDTYEAVEDVHIMRISPGCPSTDDILQFYPLSRTLTLTTEFIRKLNVSAIEGRRDRTRRDNYCLFCTIRMSRVCKRDSTSLSRRQFTVCISASTVVCLAVTVLLSPVQDTKLLRSTSSIIYLLRNRVQSLPRAINQIELY